MAQAETHETHTRASKVASYFGVSGALSFGLGVLATVLHAPFSLPGLIIIGTGVALGATDGGRAFLGKARDQILDLGNDFMSHVSEDFSRFGNWLRRVTSHKPQSAAAPAAPAAASTFKGASNAPDFNQTAKPAATVEAKPPVIQTPANNGPKIEL